MQQTEVERGLRALAEEFRQRGRRFDPTPVLDTHPGLSETVRDLIFRSVASISEGRAPEETMALLAEGIHPRHLSTFWLRLSMVVAPITFVQIEHDEQSIAKAAETHGVSLEALKALCESAFDDTTQLRGYHRELLDNGSFQFPDHLTGAQRRLSASLLVILEGRTTRVRTANFYSTSGQDGFMCLEQPLVGGLAALFIPKRNLFIATPRQHTPLPVNFLRAYMLTFALQTAAYLSEGRPRHPALLYGALEHIGHTFLNEYSVLDWCVRAGLFDNLRCILRGWVGFLPYAELLPELRGLPVQSVRASEQAYYRVVKDRLLVIRPTRTRMWISHHLVERLHALDDRMTVASGMEKDQHEGPTIWVEVRSKDRVWLGQCDGMAQLVNALSREWPNIRVVLSGWSQPGDAVPRDYDVLAIDKDKQLTAAIKAKLNQGVTCVDLTGRPTQDKIHWARRVDAYIAVYSSGFIFPHAIGRKPGIIFCNPHFTHKLLSGEFDDLIDLQPHLVPLFMLKPGLMRTKEGETDLPDANFDLDCEQLLEAVVWLLREATRRADRSESPAFGTPPPMLAPIAFDHPQAERE